MLADLHKRRICYKTIPTSVNTWDVNTATLTITSASFSEHNHINLVSAENRLKEVTVPHFFGEGSNPILQNGKKWMHFLGRLEEIMLCSRASCWLENTTISCQTNTSIDHGSHKYIFSQMANSSKLRHFPQICTILSTIQIVIDRFNIAKGKILRKILYKEFLYLNQN